MSSACNMITQKTECDELPKRRVHLKKLTYTCIYALFPRLVKNTKERRKQLILVTRIKLRASNTIYVVINFINYLMAMVSFNSIKPGKHEATVNVMSFPSFLVTQTLKVLINN